MGQSLVKNYLHIIFCTKQCQPFIDDQIEDKLFSYIAGLCNNRKCHAIRIGGYRNHIHLICMLSQKVALMNLIKDLKIHSSLWIKSQADVYKNFYWQDGYGAFSVNPFHLNKVLDYVENQREHHRNITFQEEYLNLLYEHNMPVDERYIFG